MKLKKMPSRMSARKLKKRPEPTRATGSGKDFDPGLDFEKMREVGKKLVEENREWLKYMAKR